MSDPLILPPELDVHAVIPTPSQNACDMGQVWDSLTGVFAVPAHDGASVALVCNSVNFCIGSTVWISGAGYFEVLGRVGDTGLVLKNLGVYGNAATGTNIPIGAAIVSGTPVRDNVPTTPGVEHSMIQYGAEDVTMNLGVKDENLVTVTFAAPYSVGSIPRVFLSMDKDDDMGDLFSLYVRNVSETGFDIYGSNDFAGNEDVTINWMAIGV